MMKNNKGQALVEFIIILPIFLLILIAVIDFSNIISKKYSLENSVDIVANMYLSGDTKINTYLNEIEAKIDIKKQDEFTTIILKKDVNISSPLVNVILGKKYVVKATKTIYEDKNETLE